MALILKSWVTFHSQLQSNLIRIVSVTPCRSVIPWICLRTAAYKAAARITGIAGRANPALRIAVSAKFSARNGTIPGDARSSGDADGDAAGSTDIGQRDADVCAYRPRTACKPLVRYAPLYAMASGAPFSGTLSARVALGGEGS